MKRLWVTMSVLAINCATTPTSAVSDVPAKLNEPLVSYPNTARKHQAEGTVEVLVTVDENGVVVSTVVLSGPDHGLRDAARQALRQTRFAPTLKDGKPVRHKFVYRYTFSLD